MAVADENEHAVMVASEPLGEQDHWVAVPENHLLLIDEARSVELRALEPSPTRQSAGPAAP